MLIDISNRLKAIADLVDDGSLLVDVGTDHAFLPIYLTQTGKIEKAYALDIAPGPLRAAISHIEKYDLTNKIESFLSDGLKSFHEDANTFVCSGMGSETIIEILDTYEFKVDDIVILQSNTNQYMLRKYLQEHQFVLEKEVFLIDNDKEVFIIKAIKKNIRTFYSDFELMLGPQLLMENNYNYLNYLKSRMHKLEAIYKFSDELAFEYECIIKFLRRGYYETK